MSRKPNTLEDGYQGNPRLKIKNVRQSWTKEQLAEYMKCKNDPIYFIETYCKIVHPDDGIINLNLRDYQKELVSKFHNNRFVVCMQSRQTGKSTTASSYILHYVLFNSSKTVGILANKGETAREILGRIQLAYEHLPKWLQQGVVEWNKGSCVLENNSRILAAATTGTAIRGYTFSYLFIDEAAFINEHIWDDFYKSVYPTISSGKETKITLVSTPNGYNHFYKIWTNAEEGNNSFVTHLVTWQQVPGRDEEWMKETIRNTTQHDFEQEHNCSFQGSANTLINMHTLANMACRNPIFSKDGLDILEKPDKKDVYVLVGDVAEGVGGDYSTLVVFKISGDIYKIVAKFRSNQISTLLFPDIIYRLGKDYNNAYVLLETNGPGKQVADSLFGELEYENVLTSKLGGPKGQRIDGGFGPGGSRLGIKTTTVVRRIGCNLLKTLIEEKKLLVEDVDIIQELSVFVHRKGKYQADSGYHDDLAMCLVLFSWLSNEKYFKDLNDLDIRSSLFKDQIKQIEEELTPFGFIDDGINDYGQDNDFNW